jgi:hypothetical protein
VFKKTFTITIYSTTSENTDEEQAFINDMQNQVDQLPAHNHSNIVESSVEEILDI